MINLSEQTVIDSHCHAFLPEKESSIRSSFEQFLTLAIHPIPEEDMFNTFLYRQVIRELSRILESKGSHKEIVNKRNEMYKKDPKEYISLLFDDAKINVLLVDTGYPSEEFTGYSIEPEVFGEFVPSEIKTIFRIDNVVLRLAKNRTSFDDAVESFQQTVDDAVKKGGAVGLKTVIAYRTGLEVQRHPLNEVSKAYERLSKKAKSGESVRTVFSPSKEVKTVMDHFVFLTAEKSVDLDVPLQIHVGIGDAPIIDLRKANPVLLHDFITDDSLKNAKLVLTHGGYPWIEEAGFLVNSYPNVFLDVSETVPFISIGLANKLTNLFEMAPTNKIMYGSDGYNIPELFWISALETKRALSRVLNELVESDTIEADWALEIAEQILSKNTERIYKL